MATIREDLNSALKRLSELEKLSLQTAEALDIVIEEIEGINEAQKRENELVRARMSIRFLECVTAIKDLKEQNSKLSKRIKELSNHFDEFPS